MVALALILLVLAALLVLGVVTGDGQSLTIDLFGLDVQTSAAGLFLTGVVVGLVTLLALVLLRVGLKQGWRKHQKIRDLERRARTADSDTGGDVGAGSGSEAGAGPGDGGGSGDGGGAGDAPLAGDRANETFPDGSTESWPPPDEQPETRPPSGTSAAPSGTPGPASDSDQGHGRPADPSR